MAQEHKVEPRTSWCSVLLSLARTCISGTCILVCTPGNYILVYASGTCTPVYIHSWHMYSGTCLLACGLGSCILIYAPGLPKLAVFPTCKPLAAPFPSCGLSPRFPISGWSQQWTDLNSPFRHFPNDRAESLLPPVTCACSHFILGITRSQTLLCGY